MKTKLNRIIKKALRQTVAEFKESSPVIYQHFFYGAIDLAPQNLVVCYLFETDKELQVANENGLCKKLTEATIRNLISFGYPAEVFSETHFPMPMSDKITFQDGITEEIKDVIYSLTHQKAKVAFATQEDIDRKGHGDYHLYFQ